MGHCVGVSLPRGEIDMLQKKNERAHPVPEHVAPPQKKLKTIHKASVSPRKTIRLSADIQESLHYKLKLYCVQKRQSILEVLEQWIAENCSDSIMAR
jgi:hypothetical protein